LNLEDKIPLIEDKQLILAEKRLHEGKAQAAYAHHNHNSNNNIPSNVQHKIILTPENFLSIPMHTDNIETGDSHSPMHIGSYQSLAQGSKPSSITINSHEEHETSSPIQQNHIQTNFGKNSQLSTPRRRISEMTGFMDSPDLDPRLNANRSPTPISFDKLNAQKSSGYSPGNVELKNSGNSGLPSQHKINNDDVIESMKKLITADDLSPRLPRKTNKNLPNSIALRDNKYDKFQKFQANADNLNPRIYPMSGQNESPGHQTIQDMYSVLKD